MRSEKAFTLVELLGILVVLGLITLVAFPSIITSIKRSNDKEYERFLKDLELVAETYVNENIDNFNLSEPGDVEFIELGDMVDAGYLNKRMVNPKTKKEIALNTTVLVTVLNDNTRSYEYTGTVNGIYNYNISNLKVMYDGYNKPAEDNGKIVWNDIIGNNNGEVVNADINEVWNNNKIKLGTTNNYIKVINSSSLIPADSEVTIEIVYEIYDDEATTKFRNAGLGLYYFDLYGDGLIRSMVRNSADSANNWPSATSASMAQINKVHTLTVTMNKNGSLFDFNYFGDGKPLTMSSKTGLKLNNNDFKIGQDYTTDYSPVYIHGFRLYNKALSDAEILNNYKIDMNRYNWRKK